MSDVLLTISLLCSGRKDTTELTLKSLMSIRNKVSSEIIVVDTGCDNELREVVARYADQIIPFTWIDDFSAARNVGVDAANGEWFMFIDDDEWFDSTDSIEDFFLSGKYKKFDTAAYRVKSFMNEERNITVEDWTLRLFSLKNGNRFWGMIHEYPKNELGERYYLDDVANHTGYKYESPEKAIEHSFRNIKPLLKMIEIDPENVKWVYQLAQEYRAVQNYPAMKDLCFRAADALVDVEGNSASVYRSTFYIGVILAEEEMRDPKAAREHYNLFKKDKRNNVFAQAMFYNIGAMQALADKRFEEAIDCAEKYYELYEAYHDDVKLQADGAGFFVKDAMWKETANGVLQAEIIAKIMIEQFDGIMDVFDKIDVSTAQMVGEYKLAIAVIDALADHPENENLRKLFEKQCNDIRITYKLEGAIFALHDRDIDGFNRFAAVAEEINSDYYFLSYLRTVDAKNKGDMTLFAQRVKEIPIEHFFRGVDILTGSYSYDDFALMVAEGDGLGLQDNRNKYAHMKLAEKKMVLIEPETYVDFEALLEDLVSYAATCMEFYEMYFKPEVFDGELEMLPANAKVSVLLCRFMDVMIDDFRTAFALLKEAVPLWQTTRPYINRLSALYGDFLKTKVL